MDSQVRRKSLAVVAMNKKLSSNIIECSPVEQIRLMDGELDVGTEDVVSSGIDRDNNVYTASIKMGVTVEAEWWPETNRPTPPDVRRGETVWLWHTGDSNKFYWESTGAYDDLRRLETIVFRLSGLPDNADEKLDASNTYWIEWSTHKKMVTLHTSMRNGEKAGYTLQLNTGDGQATLEDNEGNIVQLDTAATHIWARNIKDSIFELLKGDIRASVPGGSEIFMKDGDILTHNGHGVEFNMVGGNTIHKMPGNYIINATNMIVNAKTMHNKPVIGGKATYGKISVGSISGGKGSFGLLLAGKFNYP